MEQPVSQWCNLAAKCNAYGNRSKVLLTLIGRPLTTISATAETAVTFQLVWFVVGLTPRSFLVVTWIHKKIVNMESINTNDIICGAVVQPTL
jgi:hypothetical protein